jgi:hypothetical protein
MASAKKTGKPKAGDRLHHAEEVVRQHLLAAEVAAEEAAGYGSVTSAIEAAEAAVDPEHAIRSDKPAPRKRARSTTRSRGAGEKGAAGRTE